jgi:hypothetical protein
MTKDEKEYQVLEGMPITDHVWKKFKSKILE